MPEVSGKDVKKTQRRQDGTDERPLNFNVAIDDVWVQTQATFAQGVDIAAIKSLIEADFSECRRGICSEEDPDPEDEKYGCRPKISSNGPALCRWQRGVRQAIGTGDFEPVNGSGRASCEPNGMFLAA